MNNITVCTLSTRGYLKYANQLEQDCKKFGYKFCNYFLDIDDPADIDTIYFQQPEYKAKAVREHGRVLWLDAESRIINPFRDLFQGFHKKGVIQVRRLGNSEIQIFGKTVGLKITLF